MPPKLYKYRSFQVNSLRSITEAEIFYARPNTFNDPLDCDPTIEIDIDRLNLERLLYRMLLRRLSKEDTFKDINYLRYISSEYGDYKTDPEVEAYLKQMIVREIKHEIDDELGNEGVVSLSATWKSGLMWSHYADEHRGICIEYDTAEQEHPRLLPVSYNAPRAIKTSDLWKWKVHADASSKDRVIQTYFYSKSSEWRYEREWRDVSAKNGIKELPFRITAIMFGLRCDSAVITSIVKLLSEHRDIKLWQVLPKENSFKLSRRLVDRDEIEAVGVREPSFLMFKDLVFDDLDEEVVMPDPEGNDVPAVPSAEK